MEDQRAAVSRESISSQLLQSFRTPIMWVGGIMDAFFSWISSRHWLSMLASLPLMILLATPLVVSLAMRLQNREFLAREFTQIANTRIPIHELEVRSFARFTHAILPTFSYDAAIAKPEIKEQLPTMPLDQNKLQELLVIAERIVTLTPRDPLAQYRVGLIHDVSGEYDKAHEVMEKTSLLKNRKFPQVHAWLAMRLLSQCNPNESIDESTLDALVQHLEIAKKWTGLDPRMLMTLSHIHRLRNRQDESLDAARAAASIDPAFHLPYAQLAHRLGRKSEMETAADSALKYFSVRLGRENSTELDRISVADCQILLGKTDEAINTLRAGLKREKTELPELRRHLSTLLVQKFGPTLKRVDNKWTADLPLLDEAIDVDPQNPILGLQVARLLERELRPSNKAVEVLAAQLRDKNAAIETQMIVGNTNLARGRANSAVRNFEAIIQVHPKNHEAIAKLALALLRSNPPDLSRANKLIQEALEMSGPNSEYFEIYADILVEEKQLPKAVDQLEKVIKNDGSRKQAYEKLIAICKKLNLKEKVEKLENDLAELESQIPDIVQESETKSTSRKEGAR